MLSEANCRPHSTPFRPVCLRMFLHCWRRDIEPRGSPPSLQIPATDPLPVKITSDSPTPRPVVGQGRTGNGGNEHGTECISVAG